MGNNEFTKPINKISILVLGDVMLDVFQYGHVERLSPEAPVPVLDTDETHCHPGGALNVCANIRAMGASCGIIGLLGDDAAAVTIKHLCKKLSLPSEYLICDPLRPTTVKRRLFKDGIPFCRVDEECCDALSHDLEKEIESLIKKLLPGYDALIIQDYNKGLLSANLIRTAISLAHHNGLPVFVDPKLDNIEAFSGAELIKPNRHEAAQILNMTINSVDDALSAADELYKIVPAENILITLGENGCVHRNANGITHYPTKKIQAVDVTGAGDTMISALTILTLMDIPLPERIQIANKAAGIVCGKQGVASPGHIRHLLLPEDSQ